jgi:hypothetical protein
MSQEAYENREMRAALLQSMLQMVLFPHLVPKLPIWTRCT